MLSETIFSMRLSVNINWKNYIGPLGLTVGGFGGIYFERRVGKVATSRINTYNCGVVIFQSIFSLRFRSTYILCCNNIYIINSTIIINNVTRQRSIIFLSLDRTSLNIMSLISVSVNDLLLFPFPLHTNKHSQALKLSI